MVGQHKGEIEVWLKDYRLPPKVVVQFDITILPVVCRITNLEPVFTDKTIFNLVYPIRSAPVTIAMPEFTW